MDECIFCQIINGKAPSQKVYEDEHTLAFLDINPATKGHTLVVPKKHYETIQDMSEKDVARLFLTVGKVSKAIKRSLNPKGMNILQNNKKVAGQVIPHVHVKIIPRNESEELIINYKPKKIDKEELMETAKKITNNIQKKESVKAKPKKKKVEKVDPEIEEKKMHYSDWL